MCIRIALVAASFSVLAGCLAEHETVSAGHAEDALTPRTLRFGQTCNVGPVPSFLQPEVPSDKVSQVLITNVAEPPTNQFVALGTWNHLNQSDPPPTLIPVTHDLGAWTGFHVTGDRALAQRGLRDAYGAAGMQAQGSAIGLWLNPMQDFEYFSTYESTNKIGAMQAGCWFENSHTCPNQAGPTAFPTAGNRLRVALDLRVPYDGRVGPGSFDFIYVNFIFRSTCEGGFIRCGSAECADGRNNQITLGVHLFDARFPAVEFPSIGVDAYAGSPVGVGGVLASDRIDGSGTFFLRAGNSDGFQSTPFANRKHFELTITPGSFERMLIAVQNEYPGALRSLNPHDYRMVTATVISEFFEPNPPTTQDHAQLGMSVENFRVVAEGPSNANVIAVRTATAPTANTRRVHEITAVSGYQTDAIGSLAWLPPQSDGWRFLAGRPEPSALANRHDLIGVNPNDSDGVRAGTGIHVLDSRTGYATSRLDRISALGPTNPSTWVFLPGALNPNGFPDVVAINRFDGWNGTSATGIHILSGASQYQTFIGANGLTALGQANANDWQFTVGRDNSDGQHRPDIVAINLHDIDGKVGVHILSGADNYQSFLFHGLTNMGWVSSADWTFVSGTNQAGQGFRDLIGVHRNATGNVTGLRVFSAASNFTQSTAELPSALPNTQGSEWQLISTPDAR